jgi:hypothetical protein
VQRGLLPLSNSYGLGLKETVVFVCRGDAGMTVENVKKSEAPKLMYTLNDASYMDVIPFDDLLICYVKTGILLYDTKDLNKLVKLGYYTY